jgi:hypothetical protein
MNTGLRFAAISLAVALALPGNAIAAYLMPQNPTTAQVQQNAIDDITSAQSALSQERGIAALTDTENAETVLLNAQQAGNLQYPEARALYALSWADSDLQNGWNSAAALALNDAITDLG